MSQPALINLIDTKKYSPSQVGELTKDLFKLSQKGIIIAPTAIIPKYIFEKLALTTDLITQLKKALQQIKLHQSKHKTLALIRHTICQTQLPSQVTQPIIDWYQQYPGFIRVAAASHQSPPIDYQNILGETNLIESILMAWSEHMQLDLKNQQLQVFAQPILIQHQDQPQAAGIALTKTAHHKSQLAIHSVWGAYDPQHREISPDKFKVDLRTTRILERQLQPQYLRLVRKLDGFTTKTIKHYQQTNLSLTDAQVSQLAQLIIMAKRTLYTDQIISWYFYQNQFYLTHLAPISNHHQPTIDKKRLLLSGDSLQGGIAGGEIIHLTTAAAAHQVKYGQVVVTTKLTPAYQPIIKKAAAIVCDQGVSSPLLVKQIQACGIPTLINTQHATRYLKPGSQVIVNADSAQVLTPLPSLKTAASVAQTVTFTKLYIAAGNPKQAKKYLTPDVDGVGVLQSEYTFASFGEHPLHIARSKKRAQFKKKLKKTIQAFQANKSNFPIIYRSQNFTSQELRLFNHAGEDEPLEINPFLGFRGALKTISSFEVFDLELETLHEILTKNPTPLGLMLPFVRTPSELRLIVNHIFKKHQFKQQPHFSIYLQLNTPENILQLDHYLFPQLTGVCLDIKSLHALLHGIDPDNPEIYSRYPLDLKLLQIMMKKVAQLDNVKTMIHLHAYNLQLVELATQLKFDAIVVKPKFSHRAKQQILATQESNHV